MSRKWAYWQARLDSDLLTAEVHGWRAFAAGRTYELLRWVKGPTGAPTMEYRSADCRSLSDACRAAEWAAARIARGLPCRRDLPPWQRKRGLRLVPYCAVHDPRLAVASAWR